MNRRKQHSLKRIKKKTLAQARASEHGRAAELLVSDGPLRQTVLALTAGSILAEHNSPPAGSIQVLKGAIEVTGKHTHVIAKPNLVALTHYRHQVQALEDSVFLLTAVTSVPGMHSFDEEPL